MKNRWKLQIKLGLIWGFVMTAFTLLDSIKEVSIKDQFASPLFYFKVFAHCLIGIFIVGYIGWKELGRQSHD